MSNEYEIQITEGATFALSLQLSKKDELGGKTPVDMTGYTVRSQIRKNFVQSSPVIREFVTDIVSEERGEFILYLDAEATADIAPAPPSLLAKTPLGYYDIFITNNFGSVSRLMGGPVTYYQTITREDKP